MRLRFRETEEDRERRDDETFRQLRGHRSGEFLDQLAGEQEQRGFTRKGLRKYPHK